MYTHMHVCVSVCMCMHVEREVWSRVLCSINYQLLPEGRIERYLQFLVLLLLLLLLLLF